MDPLQYHVVLTREQIAKAFVAINSLPHEPVWSEYLCDIQGSLAEARRLLDLYETKRFGVSTASEPDPVGSLLKRDDEDDHKPFSDRVVVSIVPDEDADISYLDQDGFEDRQAAFDREEFFHVGIVCRAWEPGDESDDDSSLACFDTALWGIESDSDLSYFSEVALELLQELRDEVNFADSDVEFQVHAGPLGPAS